MSCASSLLGKKNPLI